MICEKCKSELPEKRTLKQNRYFYAVLNIFAQHTGYSTNEIKTLMKHEFGMYDEILNKKTGEVLINYRSTANMTKKEFSDLTENIVMFANKHGLKIMTPEEYYES